MITTNGGKSPSIDAKLLKSEDTTAVNSSFESNDVFLLPESIPASFSVLGQKPLTGD